MSAELAKKNSKETPLEILRFRAVMASLSEEEKEEFYKSFRTVLDLDQLVSVHHMAVNTLRTIKKNAKNRLESGFRDYLQENKPMLLKQWDTMDTSLIQEHRKVIPSVIKAQREYYSKIITAASNQ